MFISGQYIKDLMERERPDIGANPIGAVVDYFALVDGDQGVTGVKAVVVRLEPGEDRDGPFTVDLAVFTPVEHIFIVLKDLVVVSVEMEDRTTDESLGWGTLALAADYPKIRDIVNAPRPGERKLSLVPKAE